MEAEERFISSLESSKRHLQVADHLVYTSFPIVKDLKLLLRSLESLALCLINAINALLQYEYVYKKIQLYSQARDNFQTFKRKSPNYNITPSQLSTIIEILELAEKHKKSPLEFSKNNRIIIMSDTPAVLSLDIVKIKAYILEVKDILRKISLVIR